jgi:pantoate--beta-alanine ligase
MKLFETITGWVEARDQLNGAGKSIGFVPTMGALHEGHLSLIAKAKAENNFALVSIFVNPTQFNNREDLEKYPRTLESDLAMLEARGVDGVLLPHESQIYADGYRFKLSENEKSKILCGAFRPGHFDGVLTVVMKLLGVAQAQNCYMGEKDYQQLQLIQDLCEAFFINTKVVACPTMREPSGLAMSSRNQRLSPTARERAALIYKALVEAKTPTAARDVLTNQGFQVEYIEEHWGRRFIAAHIENVRLIDNVAI